MPCLCSPRPATTILARLVSSFCSPASFHGHPFSPPHRSAKYAWPSAIRGLLRALPTSSPSPRAPRFAGVTFSGCNGGTIWDRSNVDFCLAESLRRLGAHTRTGRGAEAASGRQQHHRPSLFAPHGDVRARFFGAFASPLSVATHRDAWEVGLQHVGLPTAPRRSTTFKTNT